MALHYAWLSKDLATLRTPSVYVPYGFDLMGGVYFMHPFSVLQLLILPLRLLVMIVMGDADNEEDGNDDMDEDVVSDSNDSPDFFLFSLSLISCVTIYLCTYSGSLSLFGTVMTFVIVVWYYYGGALCIVLL